MLKRLKDERGVSLIVALGILSVLSIVGTTLATYSTTTARDSNYQRSEDVTIDIAEAGLARALSKLAAAPNAVLPTLLSEETHTLEGGTVTVSGVLAGEMWNITSKSVVKNPRGAGDLSKTLTMKVQIGIDPSSNNAWNYVYSDAPTAAGCMTVKNNVVIGAPLFVKGNLCLENNARAEGSMVKVGGTIQTDNNASVGNPNVSPIYYVPEVKVGGAGCRHTTSGTFTTAKCSSTSPNRIWRTTFSTDPGSLVKPTVDFAYWYANAKPGPSQSCTTSTGTVPAFDNGGGMNRSNSAKEILSASAYTCEVWNGPHLQGKLSWTPDDGDADDYGVLQIIGTVFFDGDVDFKSGRKAVYSGRGTIYASGKIVFDGSTQVCGVLNCDLNAWNTEQNLVVMVSGYCADVITSCDEIDQRTTGFDVNNNAIFQGAVYAVSDFEQQNNGQMQGPVIAHQLKFENNGIANKWVAIEAMTMGTPGGGRKLNIVTTGF